MTVNIVNFSINTFGLINAGQTAYFMHSDHETKPNAIYKFNLSENIEECSIDNELINEEVLQCIKRNNSKSYSEFLKLAGRDQQAIDNVLVEMIDELELDEVDAEQQLRINLEDYCPKELSKLVDEYNIDEDDLFSSIFEYTGWQIDDIIVSDDQDIPHEIDVSFVYACELDVSLILENISALSGKEIPEECNDYLAKIITSIKSSYSLGIKNIKRE